MKLKPIFFLGGGHGGISALQSLQTVFDSIEVVSTDDGINTLARQSDTLCSNPEDIQSSSGVMAGHLGILSQSFLSQHTVLNVHYSLLPKYRGLHSLVWAMLNLESEIGLSVHIVNEAIDDGPIVYQHKHSYSGETSWELMLKFNAHVRENLGKVALDFLNGKIIPEPQDKMLASWVQRRNLADCLVRYDWPAPRLKALFLALVHPYPLPALLIKGQRFEISDAQIVVAPYFCDTGRVVNVDLEGAWIKCHDSLLVVKQLIDSTGTKHEASTLLRSGMRLEN